MAIRRVSHNSRAPSTPAAVGGSVRGAATPAAAGSNVHNSGPSVTSPARRNVSPSPVAERRSPRHGSSSSISAAASDSAASIPSWLPPIKANVGGTAPNFAPPSFHSVDRADDNKHDLTDASSALAVSFNQTSYVPVGHGGTSSIIVFGFPKDDLRHLNAVKALLAHHQLQATETKAPLAATANWVRITFANSNEAMRALQLCNGHKFQDGVMIGAKEAFGHEWDVCDQSDILKPQRESATSAPSHSGSSAKKKSFCTRLKESLFG